MNTKTVLKVRLTTANQVKEKEKLNFYISQSLQTLPILYKLINDCCSKLTSKVILIFYLI